MPSLVLNEPAGSLLHEATRVAVAAQYRDGEAHDTPWGISECAIAVRDHTLAYQYGPQGVAALALRRTPLDERVIAPYASIMALLAAPQAAVNNLRELQTLGVRRELGFIEALDYSPQRQAVDSMAAFVPVESFMAHHQAMSLLACAHVLTVGAVHRWSAASPTCARCYRCCTSVHRTRPKPWRSAAGGAAADAAAAALASRCRPLRSALPPSHLLGNSRYGVLLRANGAGYSHCEGQGLTRWRDDSLRDMHGLFAYLKRDASDRDEPWRPLAARPAVDGSARYRTDPPRPRGAAGALEDLAASTTVFVSPDDNCELRRVELHNTSRREIA